MSELAWVADSFFSAPFLTQEIPQKNRLQPCQVLVLVIREIEVAHAPKDEVKKEKPLRPKPHP